MKAPVTHINLLRRTAPVNIMAWALSAVLAVTLVGLIQRGTQALTQAQEATRRRDDIAGQLDQVKAQLAAQNTEQAKSAEALALRKDIELLQPRAKAAQALMDALRSTEGGRSDEFSRTLGAMTRLNEPGLWLTGLTVSGGGKRLELKGEARNGAAVLRYAQRANESLQALTLRMDTLEMQPAAGGVGVSFRLY